MQAENLQYTEVEVKGRHKISQITTLQHLTQT